MSGSDIIFTMRSHISVSKCVSRRNFRLSGHSDRTLSLPFDFLSYIYNRPLTIQQKFSLNQFTSMPFHIVCCYVSQTTNWCNPWLFIIILMSETHTARKQYRLELAGLLCAGWRPLSKRRKWSHFWVKKNTFLAEFPELCPSCYAKRLFLGET